MRRSESNKVIYKNIVFVHRNAFQSRAKESFRYGDMALSESLIQDDFQVNVITLLLLYPVILVEFGSSLVEKGCETEYVKENKVPHGCSLWRNMC